MINLELVAVIVALVLALIAYKDLPHELLLVRKLRKGSILPRRIEEFPIHKTSLEDYLASKAKVEIFIEKTGNGIEDELVLSQDDLNHIYLRGFSIDKYKLETSGFLIVENDFSYFEINKDKIVIHRLKYPKISGHDKGILTERTLLWYEYSDGIIFREKKKLVNINSRNMQKFYDGSYDFLWNISSM
jgi:hypothetical protein